MADRIALNTLAAPVDLSAKDFISFTITASRTGSYLWFGISEDNTTWHEYAITIAAANVAQTEAWDIISLAAADRDAVLYTRLRFSGETEPVSATIDSIQSYAMDLLENPSGVIQDFLVSYGGFTTAEIDATSFSAAQASLAAAVSGGYRFAGVINRRTGLNDLLARMVRQCRCRIFGGGDGVRLVFQAAAGAVQKSIPDSMLAAGSLRLSRTGMDEVVNDMKLFYDMDWARGRVSAANFKAVCDRSDAYPAGGDMQSVSVYGPRERPDMHLMEFIVDEAAAVDLRDFYITRYKDVKRHARFTLFMDNLELEAGDIISVEHAGLAVDTAGAVFRIESAGFRPGSAVRGRPDEVLVCAREV